jgi:RNA polymerase sigma factor (sigma-70 family)
VSNVGTTNLTARATDSEDPSGRQAGRILAGPSRSTAGKPDETLVKLAKLGDEGAIATLYERYSAAILRYCCSILRSQQEAEDIQQEVFLHAIAALRHGPGPISFRPWLYRVAHNACISHLRSRKPTVVVEDASLASAATEPETVQREELRQLLADISRLSPVQRGALLLREMDGFSYEQIAAALDLPLTTVRSTIFRARATLQGMAEARDADCETIQAELSEMADRRGRRSRRITSHLRVCNQCREFREGLRYRPAAVGEYAPSRLDVLRSAKVAAVIAGLLAIIGAGLHALGALGSSGGGAPATAQRHRLKAPIAPAVTPRVVTIPAPRPHGAAPRGIKHDGSRLSAHPALAAPRAVGEEVRSGAGHRPAAVVRHRIDVHRRSATIRPQAGGEAIPLPQSPTPHAGSGSGSGSATPQGGASDGSGSGSAGTGAGAAGVNPGTVSSGGSGAGGSSTSSPSAGSGDGSGTSSGGGSGASGSSGTDPGSPDRPQVTHNDSTSDPGASGAVGVGADAPTGSGDATSGDQPAPPPPPAVTANTGAAAP